MVTDKEIEAVKNILRHRGHLVANADIDAALTAAEQVRASEPNDSKRFQQALIAIAAMPDENDEWDGCDKFREVRAIAQNATKILFD